MNKKFYICEKCGNIIEMIHSSGAPIVCCGQKMTELEAGVVEASREKHIPVVKKEAGSVTAVVGSVTHPMTEEHSITWVYLETNRGGQRKALSPGEEPTVTFNLADGEEPIAVYSFCNLHGLWKAEL